MMSNWTLLWKWEDGHVPSPEVLGLGQYVTFALSVTSGRWYKVSTGGERSGGPTSVT